MLEKKIEIFKTKTFITKRKIIANYFTKMFKKSKCFRDLKSKSLTIKKVKISKFK
jgi:hypothetical protein